MASLPRVLFPALTDPPDKVALRFGERELSYRQLRDAATAVAEQVAGKRRVERERRVRSGDQILLGGCLVVVL